MFLNDLFLGLDLVLIKVTLIGDRIKAFWWANIGGDKNKKADERKKQNSDFK